MLTGSQRKSDSELKLCEAFLANPSINPETGKKLIQGKGPYIEYIRLCEKYGMMPRQSPIRTQPLIRRPPSTQPIFMAAKTKDSEYIMDPLQTTKTTRQPIKSPRQTTKTTRQAIKSPRITTKIPYIRPTDLPEGFTGIKELDMAILIKLDIKTIENLKFISSWINELINSREFLDIYSNMYGLCPLTTFKTFDELHKDYNLKHKEKGPYIYRCINKVTSETLDELLSYTTRENFKTENILDYLIYQTSEISKKSLLYEVLNKFQELYGSSKLMDSLSKTINILASNGDLDLLKDVISKYKEILVQPHPNYYNVRGVVPYIDMAEGALDGNQKDILKLAFHELMEIDLVNQTNIFEDLSQNLFRRHMKDPKKKRLLTSVIEELTH
jgi:hypothetical protein